MHAKFISIKLPKLDKHEVCHVISGTLHLRQSTAVLNSTKEYLGLRFCRLYIILIERDTIFNYLIRKQKITQNPVYQNKIPICMF